MNKERLLQRFLQYVTCASETYQEREFCIMMEEELTSLGLHWERQEIGEMFGSNGWNLHAILPGTGAPLLLCAHMDTVAPGYGISPILRDGVIYSDGTTILGSDDKAGIAAAMEAVQTIVEKGLPHRPIEFLLTICEENGIIGSKYADYSKIISKEAIVLDNEDVGHLVNQAAAYMKIHFSIQGKSAHAGVSPEKGIHALKAVAECISGIECGRVSEISVVNVANLLCPGQTNIVPEKADFDVEVRSYEEEELQSIVQNICGHVEKVCQAWGAKFCKTENRVSNAFCIPVTAPIIEKTCEAMRSIGITPVIEQTLGGSDITWLVENGLAAINIGVGMQEVHGCKEHILFEDMISTTEVLLRVLTT